MAPIKNILEVTLIHIFNMALTLQFNFDLHGSAFKKKKKRAAILVLISSSEESTKGSLLMGQWTFLTKQVIWK